jgi:tetratricopeptide (TPR) repeat protein
MTRPPTNPFHPKVRGLCERLARAQQPSQERPPAEVRDELLQILADANNLGLPAPDIVWGLGCLSDHLGDFPAAIAYCRKALELDPLSPSYRRSWSIVIGRVREAVLEESRPPDDPELLTLCRLLASHGAADEAVHARHARLLVAAGNGAEAQALLEAVLKLSPCSGEALAVLAEIAAANDDDDLAGRVRAAAMSSRQPNLPLALTQPKAQA